MIRLIFRVNYMKLGKWFAVLINNKQCNGGHRIKTFYTPYEMKNAKTAYIMEEINKILKR